MDYGDQGAVRVGLAGVACVKPWPVPHLDAFSAKRGTRDSSRPRGPMKSPVTVSITGFNTHPKTSFKDRFDKRFQELISKNVFDYLSPFCESSARNLDQRGSRGFCVLKEAVGLLLSLVSARTNRVTQATPGIHFFLEWCFCLGGFPGLFLVDGLVIGFFGGFLSPWISPVVSGVNLFYVILRLGSRS